MINSVFDEIPTPDAIEYDGEIPSAFARLPAFSPPLAELRSLQTESVRPTLWSGATAARAQSDPQPATPGTNGPAPEDLDRFKALMAAERWLVRVPRMQADRKYACDRIVLAYTSANPELLALARHLFKVFQARGTGH